jgi:hypothetical protein
MAFSLKKLKEKDPSKYNRIGLALEEFVCEQNLQSKICEKYNIGSNLFASCIEAYFGTPGERVMIRFEMVEEGEDTPTPSHPQSQSQPQLAL